MYARILPSRPPSVRWSAQHAIACMHAASSNLNGPPHSSIPVIETVAALRDWRGRAFAEGKTVGFVPTMGALHPGHLSLGEHSLQDNDLTVLSIFVNPTQFAPHEDLMTYPRTLTQDLDHLSTVQAVVPDSQASNLSNGSGSNYAPPEKSIRRPSAVFLPSVREMYPSGASQDLAQQKGTFVDVVGYGNLMEGRSRPTFFRGVSTVVTKLFNAVQPTNAYFGQKDIQQALLLRRMQRDLLSVFPAPENLHVIPTARDPTDNLALSSRNAYLSAPERKYATTLYRALTAGKEAFLSNGEHNGIDTTKTSVLECAQAIVRRSQEAAREEGVEIKLDYIEVNDPWTFELVGEEGLAQAAGGGRERLLILSGALWVGRTRLIDNVLLGDERQIVY